MFDRIKSMFGFGRSTNGHAVAQLNGSPESDSRAAQYDDRDQQTHGQPQGIVLPWFSPYWSEFTQETEAIRRAYREMPRDPNVKAALLGKIYAVSSLPLKIKPPNPRPSKLDDFGEPKEPALYQREAIRWAQQREIAEFCTWNLKQRLNADGRGGLPRAMEDVFYPGLIDGYSVCEKVRAPQQQGRWAGKQVLSALKSVQTYQNVVLQTNDKLDVVDVMGLQFNAGEHFDPLKFIIWQHLPVFEGPLGTSDLRAVYSRWWMLETTLKFRALFFERRASPFVVGTYKAPTTQNSVNAMMSQLKQLGYVGVPESVTLAILDASGKSESEFKSFVDDLIEQIFLGITGATLQHLTGGAGEQRGNSKVQQSTSGRFNWRLAESWVQICNDCTRGLIKYIVDPNYQVDEYPLASLDLVDAEELKGEAEIDKFLAGIGWQFSRMEFEERYGRKWCEDPEDLIKPPPQPMMPGQPNGQPGSPGGSPDPNGQPASLGGRPPGSLGTGSGGPVPAVGGPQVQTPPDTHPASEVHAFGEHDVSGEKRDESGKWTGGGHRGRLRAAVEGHHQAKAAHQKAQGEFKAARKAAYDAERGHAARAMETFRAHADAISNITDDTESDEDEWPEATRAFNDLDEAKHRLNYEAESHAEKREALGEVKAAAESLGSAEDATPHHKEKAAEILAHVKQAGKQLAAYRQHRLNLKKIRGGEAFAEWDESKHERADDGTFGSGSSKPKGGKAHLDNLKARAAGYPTLAGAVGAFTDAYHRAGVAKTRAEVQAALDPIKARRAAEKAARAAAQSHVAEVEPLAKELFGSSAQEILSAATDEAVRDFSRSLAGQVQEAVRAGRKAANDKGLSRSEILKATRDAGDEIRSSNLLDAFNSYFGGSADEFAAALDDSGVFSDADWPPVPSDIDPYEDEEAYDAWDEQTAKPQRKEAAKKLYMGLRKAFLAHRGESFAEWDESKHSRDKGKFAVVEKVNAAKGDAAAQGQLAYDLSRNHGVRELRAAARHLGLEHTGAPHEVVGRLEAHAKGEGAAAASPKENRQAAFDHLEKSIDQFDGLSVARSSLLATLESQPRGEQLALAARSLGRHFEAAASQFRAAYAEGLTRLAPSVQPDATGMAQKVDERATACQTHLAKYQESLKRLDDAPPEENEPEPPEEPANADDESASKAHDKAMASWQKQWDGWSERSDQRRDAEEAASNAFDALSKADDRLGVAIDDGGRKLERLLSRTRKPSTAATSDHSAHVADAVRTHGGESNLASLVNVRKHLADAGVTDRSAQDAAIDDARRKGLVTGSALEGRHGTTEEERAAQHGTGEDRIGHLSLRPQAEPLPFSEFAEALAHFDEASARLYDLRRQRWESFAEHDVSNEPRDESGKWTAGHEAAYQKAKEAYKLAKEALRPHLERRRGIKEARRNALEEKEAAREAKETAREEKYQKKARAIAAKIKPEHSAAVLDAIAQHKTSATPDRKARGKGGAPESAVLEALAKHGVEGPAAKKLLDQMVYLGRISQIGEGAGVGKPLDQFYHVDDDPDGSHFSERAAQHSEDFAEGHWVTLKNGAHAFIGGNGRIMKGPAGIMHLKADELHKIPGHEIAKHHGKSRPGTQRHEQKGEPKNPTIPHSGHTQKTLTPHTPEQSAAITDTEHQRKLGEVDKMIAGAHNRLQESIGQPHEPHARQSVHELERLRDLMKDESTAYPSAVEGASQIAPEAAPAASGPQPMQTPVETPTTPPESSPRHPLDPASSSQGDAPYDPRMALNATPEESARIKAEGDAARAAYQQKDRENAAAQVAAQKSGAGIPAPAAPKPSTSDSSKEAHGNSTVGNPPVETKPTPPITMGPPASRTAPTTPQAQPAWHEQEPAQLRGSAGQVKYATAVRHKRLGEALALAHKATQDLRAKGDDATAAQVEQAYRRLAGQADAGRWLDAKDTHGGDLLRRAWKEQQNFSEGHARIRFPEPARAPGASGKKLRRELRKLSEKIGGMQTQAPTIHVHPPQNVVNVGSPVINIQAPEPLVIPAPQVVMPSVPRKMIVERDKDGKISGTHEVEQ